MPHPRVSVFIASYNHGRYIAECLDSILAQTYRDFEIVIVDDWSTDDTREILLGYQKHFPETIHCYCHPCRQNRGISATSNMALAKSKGEYLAWTGSDDIWYPEKLESQVACMDANPDCAFVYGYAHFIDENGMRLDGLCGTDVTSDSNPLGRMIQFCHPPAMTVMIRRRCLEEAGLFDENLVYSDWDLWIRMLAHGKAGFIGRPLALYRIHGRNVSKKISPQLNLQRVLELMVGLRAKSEKIGGALVKPRNLALLDLQIAFLLFCSGKESEARDEVHRAFARDPSLNSDAQFLNEWLNGWKPEFYTTSHQHFGLWFIASLPNTCSLVGELTALQMAEPETSAFFVRRGIHQGMKENTPGSVASIFGDWPGSTPLPPAWRARILKEIYAALLFETYKTRDFTKVRYYLAKAIQYNPAWLLNRGVWSIGFQAFCSMRD